jgi:hypothetical protein
MDGAVIQTIVVGAIVLGATLFLGRRAWRTVGEARKARRTDAGGCATCGCGETSHGSAPRPKG